LLLLQALLYIIIISTRGLFVLAAIPWFVWKRSALCRRASFSRKLIAVFEELIDADFYYVDKTRFIKELLDNWSKVNLFLRPRRFGKALTLSTIQCFFEDTGDEEANTKRRGYAPRETA
jgi:hypothetical protein